MQTKEHLIVSTTTSLFETGVLDVLKTEFERVNPNINVSFISQGTGLAIQTAMRGDADLILVHDPVREIKFLEDGYGVNRKIIAYNFFVIVGPVEDPAEIKNLEPLKALQKIREMGIQGKAQWISRGDDSGTHGKEKRLWAAAGFEVTDFEQEEWYIEAGSGMTATLRLANEKQAYTLADIGTYLKVKASGTLDVEIIVESGEETINVYGAIVDNPQRDELKDTEFDASMKFLEFLVSEEGQKIFNDFGRDKFGIPLFYPYVTLLNTNNNPQMIEWIQDYAYFEGSECPNRYRYLAQELYETS
jgi:tungstate transport system substrate-binding protein